MSNNPTENIILIKRRNGQQKPFVHHLLLLLADT